MSENEFYKIDKLLPDRTKPQETYVDDNLQIHIPKTREAAHLENTNAFNKLLSYYNEVGRLQQTAGGLQLGERESIRLELTEAENTFKSMIDVSNQLRQASEELVQMQS